MDNQRNKGYTNLLIRANINKICFFQCFAICLAQGEIELCFIPSWQPVAVNKMDMSHTPQLQVVGGHNLHPSVWVWVSLGMNCLTHVLTAAFCHHQWEKKGCTSWKASCLVTTFHPLGSFIKALVPANRSEEHSSPKCKKAEDQASICQEIEALRAEIEQLKALVGAPTPPPTPQVVSWDSSLCI